MQKVNKLIVIIWQLLFIILSLSLAILPISNSKSYYIKQHKINDVLINLKNESNVLITSNELEDISNNMVDYLFNRTKSMQYQLADGTNFFSNQAISHMKDVKTLFYNGVIISYVLLASFIILTIYIIINFKKIKVNYFKVYLCIFIILALLLIMITIFALNDFDKAFTIFHKIIFPNQDKFNSAFFDVDDTLIILLPINFFMKITIIIASIFVAMSSIGALSCYLLRKLSKKLENNYV